LWLLGALLIAPWLVFGGWILARRTAVQPAARVRAAVVTPQTGDLVPNNPGPWGTLESFRILIEPPEEFILEDYTHTEIKPWVFKGYTDGTLTALWDDAGLEPVQRTFLGDPAHREIKPDAIVIHPDRDVILGLSPTQRAKIYSALAEFPENTAQYNPFRLRSALAADWLAETGVSDEAVALTKRLLYPRGVAMCFSDDAVVLPLLHTAAERVRYLKALSRKSGLLVQLRIAPGENVDPLVAYWGRGGRSKDLKPLLQSLARRPEGGAIDIVHLVPRFARLLAYTYPLPSERPLDAAHDCHWTAFNFQNDQPDERLANIDYVRQVLLEQYYPVFGPPLLGDIVIFVRKDGTVIHSCVYIADDIVFTKNGPAFSVPWLFAPLADVQAFYASGPGVEMRRYRAKNL
jgi:hypothetical protein